MYMLAHSHKQFVTTLLVTLVVVLSGCASPVAVRCGISRGSYLTEQQYAALQREAAEIEVTVPKTSAIKDGRRPMVSYAYFVESNADLTRETSILIPDFDVIDKNGASFAKSVPDQLAVELRSRKIFANISRTNGSERVKITCAISKRDPGSWIKRITLGPIPSYMQVEGRFLLDGKDVGAFQINSQKAVTGWNITTAILSAVEGSSSYLIASKVCDMFEDIKRGKSAGAQCEDTTLLTDEAGF